MKDAVYLVFTKKSVIRMAKKHPTTSSGEFSVKINFEVPAEFFNKAPMPECSIVLPEEYVVKEGPRVELMNYE